jgi:hypothetical protein
VQTPASQLGPVAGLEGSSVGAGECHLFLMPAVQVTSDIPAHHLLKFNDSDRDIDKTTRGLGATRSNPTTSCGEENLTMVDDW